MTRKQEANSNISVEFVVIKSPQSLDNSRLIMQILVGQARDQGAHNEQRAGHRRDSRDSQARVEQDRRRGGLYAYITVDEQEGRRLFAERDQRWQTPRCRDRGAPRQ